VEDYDQREFTHCRAYSAQTEIIFNYGAGEAAVSPRRWFPRLRRTACSLTVRCNWSHRFESRVRSGNSSEGNRGEVA